ncbi:MAG: four-carbon acid sugar kinase family protein [Elusimicrobia bacterium]|nr:four-carbon acid sugar kinase family protein [Elusimicrobiota bacterium]
MIQFFPLGIVADDLTGCGDVGYFCARAGLSTIVQTSPSQVGRSERSRTSVLIVNTESRHDRPEVASRKVRTSVRALRQWGSRWIYKKIDSTLRGNIGAELAAVVDELKLTALPLVAAFPRMGRTTQQGFQYLYRKRLDHTVFLGSWCTTVSPKRSCETSRSTSQRIIRLLWRERRGCWRNCFHCW